MVIVYPILVASFTGIFYIAYQFLYRKKLQVQDRLTALEDMTTSGGRGVEKGKIKTPLQKALALPIHRRVVLPVARRLTDSLERLLPTKILLHLEREVITSGLSYRVSFREVMVLYFVLICVGAVLGLSAVMVLRAPMWVLPVFVLLGGLVPRLWLLKKVNSRKETIQRDLPEFLDLLTVSVDAGLGFESALKKVAEEGSGHLALEIKRLVSEIGMGKSRKEALTDLRDRVEVQDLSTFINAIIQAEQLGVGVSRVLKIEAGEFRRKRRQRAEEQAMKAPVKLLIPLVLFIFPTIFIILLGPAALRITETLFGLF